MDLTSKVMLVGLNISVFSGERIDRKVTEEVAQNHNADAKDSGRFAKQIIGKLALEPIKKLACAARTEHYTLTLPYDTGMRMLSVTGYMDYCAKLRGYRNQFNDAVQEFILDYPRLVEAARARLGSLFSLDDYPPIDALRARFAFEVTASPLPNARNWFLELAEDEMAELQAQADARVQSTVEAAVKDTYRRVAEVTSKMSEKLRSYQPGEPKGVFRDSLVENVRELAEILPSLNITADPTLAEITDEMRANLCNFDAGLLRADPELRNQTAEAAQAIYDKLAGFF